MVRFNERVVSQCIVGLTAVTSLSVDLIRSGADHPSVRK